jgi:ribosomal protein S12 methylthiotransferase accessory factor
MTAATAPHDPLAALCSPYTGIVSTVEECLCMPTDARLIRVACELASSSSLLGASLRHIQGVGGAGFTLAEARAAAVGEAAERYSASHLPRERFVEASADELGAGAVDPERFALFARDQYETDGFPFVPFHRGTRVQWVEGIALPGREPAWIPVELVYLADAIEPGRPRIGYATSSGMACAGSEIEAVERGLLELLERDAFMLAWSNRLSLPRVDWKDHAEAAALEPAVDQVLEPCHAAKEPEVARLEGERPIEGGQRVTVWPARLAEVDGRAVTEDGIHFRDRLGVVVR